MIATLALLSEYDGEMVGGDRAGCHLRCSKAIVSWLRDTHANISSVFVLNPKKPALTW